MAGIYFGDGGTTRAMTSITFGDAGTNRNITEIYFGDAGTNRLVWPAITVSLNSRFILDSVLGGAASARYELSSAGLARSVTNSGGTTSFAPDWLQGGGLSSAYDARWTNTSGAITTGTAGVWQNLGTTRSYGIARGSFGTTSCIGTLEIRDAATLIVLATATITLEAEWA